MASDSEASCESDPNFAVICAFMEKFGVTCGLATIDFLELQEMLENTQEVSQELIDLHIKLLRKSRKSVSTERWEKAIIKFCHTFCVQDAWEIERFGYKKARLSSKLRILKELLEMQFDFNVKFKAEINKMSADELRSQPLGKDKLGHAYWFQSDNNCQIRVYKEDPDEETWTLVAKDRQGLLSLINELGDGDSKLSSESTINEDSNSLAEKPIIDTGQVESNGSDSKKSDESENSNESKKEHQDQETVVKEEKETSRPDPTEEEKKPEVSKRIGDDIEDEKPSKKAKLENGNETLETGEVSETIEEPVMVVKGEGSGCENECVNNTDDNPIVGEEIEEPLMYIVGVGSGRDCETGNGKQSDSNNDNNSKNQSDNDTMMTESSSGSSSNLSCTKKILSINSNDENTSIDKADIKDAVDTSSKDVPISPTKNIYKLGTIIDTKTDNKSLGIIKNPSKKSSRWDVETHTDINEKDAAAEASDEILNTDKEVEEKPVADTAQSIKKPMFFFGPGCMSFKPKVNPMSFSATVGFGLKVPQNNTNTEISKSSTDESSISDIDNKSDIKDVTSIAKNDNDGETTSLVIENEKNDVIEDCKEESHQRETSHEVANTDHSKEIEIKRDIVESPANETHGVDKTSESKVETIEEPMDVDNPKESASITEITLEDSTKNLKSTEISSIPEKKSSDETISVLVKRDDVEETVQKTDVLKTNDTIVHSETSIKIISDKELPESNIIVQNIDSGAQNIVPNENFEKSIDRLQNDKDEIILPVLKDKCDQEKAVESSNEPSSIPSSEIKAADICDSGASTDDHKVIEEPICIKKHAYVCGPDTEEQISTNASSSKEQIGPNREEETKAIPIPEISSEKSTTKQNSEFIENLEREIVPEAEVFENATPKILTAEKTTEEPVCIKKKAYTCGPIDIEKSEVNPNIEVTETVVEPDLKDPITPDTSRLVNDSKTHVETVEHVEKPSKAIETNEKNTDTIKKENEIESQETIEYMETNACNDKQGLLSDKSISTKEKTSTVILESPTVESDLMVNEKKDSECFVKEKLNATKEIPSETAVSDDNQTIVNDIQITKPCEEIVNEPKVQRTEIESKTASNVEIASNSNKNKESIEKSIKASTSHTAEKPDAIFNDLTKPKNEIAENIVCDNKILLKDEPNKKFSELHEKNDEKLRSKDYDVVKSDSHKTLINSNKVVDNIDKTTLNKQEPAILTKPEILCNDDSEKSKNILGVVEETSNKVDLTVPKKSDAASVSETNQIIIAPVEVTNKIEENQLVIDKKKTVEINHDSKNVSNELDCRKNQKKLVEKKESNVTLLEAVEVSDKLEKAADLKKLEKAKLSENLNKVTTSKQLEKAKAIENLEKPADSDKKLIKTVDSENSEKKELQKVSQLENLKRSKVDKKLEVADSSEKSKKVPNLDKLNKNAVSEKLAEVAVPEKSEKPKAPENLAKSKTPEKLEEVEVSKKLEKSTPSHKLEKVTVPEKLEKLTSSEKLDRAKASEKLEKPTAPVSLEDTSSSEKLEERAVPEKVEVASVSEKVKKPPVTEMSEKADLMKLEIPPEKLEIASVPDKLQKPTVAEKSDKPIVTELEERPVVVANLEIASVPHKPEKSVVTENLKKANVSERLEKANKGSEKSENAKLPEKLEKSMTSENLNEVDKKPSSNEEVRITEPAESKSRVSTRRSLRSKSDVPEVIDSPVIKSTTVSDNKEKEPVVEEVPKELPTRRGRSRKVEEATKKSKISQDEVEVSSNEKPEVVETTKSEGDMMSTRGKSLKNKAVANTKQVKTKPEPTEAPKKSNKLLNDKSKEEEAITTAEIPAKEVKETTKKGKLSKAKSEEEKQKDKSEVTEQKEPEKNEDLQSDIDKSDAKSQEPSSKDQKEDQNIENENNKEEPSKKSKAAKEKAAAEKPIAARTTRQTRRSLRENKNNKVPDATIDNQDLNSNEGADSKEQKPKQEDVIVLDSSSSDFVNENSTEASTAAVEENNDKAKAPMSLSTFSLDFNESAPSPPPVTRNLRKRGREPSPPSQEATEEASAKKIKKDKEVVEEIDDEAYDDNNDAEIVISSENEQAESVPNQEPKKTKSRKKGRKKKKKAVRKNTQPPKTNEESSTKDEKGEEANNDNKEATAAVEKTEDAGENKEEGETKTEVKETSDETPKKKSNKNKRILSNLGIDSESQQNLENTATPVRQSRRIAQLKIKEEAERRKLEEELAREVQEIHKKKKKKSDDKDYKAEKRKSKVDSDDDHDGAETEKAEKKKKKKRKKKEDPRKLFDEFNPWKSSSDDDSSDAEDEEEEEVEDYDEEPMPYVSDHEFSPESDIEGDGEALPLKRARTARKESEDEEVDDCPCQKCNKSDHPEWILLCDRCDNGWHCSCLRPPLLVIPEGDWFCPPCQHVQLLQKLQEKLVEYDKRLSKKEIEDRRKERLAFVGISLNNVLPAKDPSEVKKKRRESQDYDGDNYGGNDDYDSSSGESESEESESSSGSGSESDEPTYQLRQRRQAHSYRFNDYDELINSAIQDEMEAVKGAGNQGRGKDIATIVNAEKEEERKKLEVSEEVTDTPDATAAAPVAAAATAAEVPFEGPEPLPPLFSEENREPQPLNNDDDDDDDEDIRPVKKRPGQRKKSRKLNNLDISSGDDEDSDDEDFKGSSSESEDEFDDDLGSEDSEDLDTGRRRKNLDPVRRSTRARTSRYDADFIDDGDSDDDFPKKKKKRSFWDESESEEESDRSWGRRKKKPRSQRKPTVSSVPKRKKAKKKKRRGDDDSDVEVFRKKKPKIKFGLDDDAETPGRRTRGKKINYVDALGSDSDEDRGRRPPPRIESDEEYVANEDEEMQEDDKISEEEVDSSEEINPNKQKMMNQPYGGPALHPSVPTIVAPSHSVIPPPHIYGKADIDMNAPTIDEINKNLEEMDENEMEKMMEEEEYANKQLQLVALQLEREKKRKEMEAQMMPLRQEPTASPKKRGRKPKIQQFEFPPAMEDPMMGNVDSMIVNPDNNDELSEPPGVSLPLFADMAGNNDNLEDLRKRKVGRPKKIDDTIGAQDLGGYMGVPKGVLPQESNIEIAPPPQPFSQSQPTPSVITRMLQSKPGQPGYPIGTIRPKQFAAMPEREEDIPPHSIPSHQIPPPYISGGIRPQVVGAPYRHLPPAPNIYTRGPPPNVQHQIRNSVPQTIPSHIYPPGGGNGPMNMSGHNSPGRVSSPAASASPNSTAAGGKNETPPPPPYVRPPLGRFPTAVAGGVRPLPHVIPPHLQQTPRPNLPPYHPNLPPNYQYPGFPSGPSPMSSTDEGLPPPAVFQNPAYPDQYQGDGNTINPAESGGPAKPFDEEGGGEFGGLVSYFSSQREDDLES